MSMMGELNYFLGLQIKQLSHGTFLSQTKYCKESLKKFDMENCKEILIPMATNCHLDSDEKGTSVDQTKYRGLIGSLLYLTASSLDIMFSVCLCARFQSNLKESHFTTTKRILKYLQGTTNVGLWYPSKVSLNLVGYSNSNFAGCKIHRKNTSGTCHLLGSQSLWIKQQLSDFGLNLSKIPLLCDNTSATNLTKNPIQHSRTKHIEIRHHFIRDHVNNGDYEIQFVSTENQLTDLFTKSLNKEKFNFLQNELGIIDFKFVK